MGSPWRAKFSSVQSLSRVQLFATPWTAAHQASLSITNSQSLPKLMSIESVMPSNHLFLLSSPSPAFNPSQHQGLFKWVSSSHQVAKIVLEFQLTPRTDLLQDGLVGSPCSPRDSQESSPTPQFKSINSSMLSFLYSPTLTSIHDHWRAKATGNLSGGRGHKCRCNITGVKAEIWSMWKRFTFYAYIVFSSFVSVITTQNYTQFYILCACEHSQSCLSLSPTRLPYLWDFNFQARILEWLPIYSSRGSSRPKDPTCVSCLSFTGRGDSLPLRQLVYNLLLNVYLLTVYGLTDPKGWMTYVHCWVFKIWALPARRRLSGPWAHWGSECHAHITERGRKH